MKSALLLAVSILLVAFPSFAQTPAAPTSTPAATPSAGVEDSTTPAMNVQSKRRSMTADMPATRFLISRRS